VVKEPSGDVEGVRKRLEGVAAVQTITGDLLVVTPTGTAREPTAAWREIRDAVDSAEWVAPVVVDAAGRRSYPTGAVTVRFAKDTSEADVMDFGQKYGMRPVRRNEYVPEQVVFAPDAARETYLPELIDRVSGDERVKAAWPVTVSSYDRVDRS
jgi:hypothetical protein